MLVATTLERVFVMTDKNQTVPLADPNPDMSPQAVQNFYANLYPILTTSKVSGPTMKDDKWEYRFESVMGTKG